MNNDGIQFTSKTAFGFYSVADKSKAIAKETAIRVQDIWGKIDLSKFDSFKERYIEALKKNNIQPNFVHMVGSFLASTEKERTKELVEKCKETLK